MKKVILFAALLTGCVAFANARFTVSENTVTSELTINDYKEVALADLSEVVQNAVKELAGDTYTVKKVEFDAEKELTRVTLAEKENGNEKTVILNKEGKEVKDE
jgi:hypothetical protein